MDFSSYVPVIRAFWRSITAISLLCVLGSAAFSFSSTPIYRAAVQLFVSAQGGATDIGNQYQGSLFSEARVQSYADIVTSDAVIGAVIKDLKLQVDPSVLQAQISASAPVNTVLINISVMAASPQSAQAIANSVGGHFATFVNQLEAPSGGQPSAVRVSVVRPARLPIAPISPHTELKLILGLVVGSMLGLGQAILRASLDTRIKSLENLTATINVPLLGLIPFDPEASDHPVIVAAGSHSLRSEAFRQLRTNLQFIDIDNAPKSIVVTSSVPQEGKTTSTANLAITMVRAGMRVVVVEADLRRPRLMAYLGVEGTHPGLTDILIGRTSIDDALVQEGPGGVAFLASGSVPPNPSELLSSVAMQRVIADLAGHFDVILLDAPPLLPVTDAAILSRLTDGVVLLVRAGSTRRAQVARSRQILEGVDARILGVVLNRVDRKSRDAYGYYYYSASEASKKSPRDADAEVSTFTPDRIIPAKPQRRAKPDQRAWDQAQGARLAGSGRFAKSSTGTLKRAGGAETSTPDPSSGAVERADNIRAAVSRAFNRGSDQSPKVPDQSPLAGPKTENPSSQPKAD